MRSKKHYVIYQDCYCFISLNKKMEKNLFPLFFRSIAVVVLTMTHSRR